MNTNFFRKSLPFIVSIPLTFSGCSSRSECEIPVRHVHEYSILQDGIFVKRYIDSEELEHGLFPSWNWSPDYMEITKEDEKIYRLLSDNTIIEGESNWDYLFNLMYKKKDYLEFYYESTSTYTVVDDDGNTKVKTDSHYGWHLNPNDSTNTGRVRLCHYRYFCYRIVYKDGQYGLEQSPYVDDIRDVLSDYPYCSIIPCTLETREFNFRERELPYLNAYDDFNTFDHPDLSNSSLYHHKR